MNVSKMEKLQIYLVLALMFILNSCAFYGVDFTVDRTIAIQKSPYVIIFDGDLTNKDFKNADRMLALLARQPFEDANNSNFQVLINNKTEVVKSETITNTSDTARQEQK